MRVLVIAASLPSKEYPGTMAPAARQIESLKPFLSEVKVINISGYPVFKYLRSIRQIRKLSPAYDLVHAHYGLSGFSAVRGSTVPVVLSLMGSDILPNSLESNGNRILLSIEQMVSRYASGKATQVIVKSAQMAEKLEPIKSTVIPNGVDMEVFSSFSKKKARELLYLDNDSIYVLFGGDPSNIGKNYSLAEKSVEHLSTLTSQNIKLLALNGIQPDSVPIYLNACNCLLFTSSSEGSPNVLKECLACNTPVVSVDVGDSKWLLEGVQGCYICNYDSKQLGNRMFDVINKHEACNGRDTLLEKNLDLVSTAHRVLEVYRMALGNS